MNHHCVSCRFHCSLSLALCRWFISFVYLFVCQLNKGKTEMRNFHCFQIDKSHCIRHFAPADCLTGLTKRDALLISPSRMSQARKWKSNQQRAFMKYFSGFFSLRWPETEYHFTNTFLEYMVLLLLFLNCWQGKRQHEFLYFSRNPAEESKMMGKSLTESLGFLFFRDRQHRFHADY